jgi:hypothetical protein
MDELDMIDSEIEQELYDKLSENTENMIRHQYLYTIWFRLWVLLTLVIFFGGFLSVYAFKATTTIFIIFLAGNVGSFISIHKNLNKMTANELKRVCGSWLSVVLPSFIGGLLAVILYLFFLSGVVSGDLFPHLVNDTGTVNALVDIFKDEGSRSVLTAINIKDFAKLVIWSFIAGYNQAYVIDILDSLKGPE